MTEKSTSLTRYAWLSIGAAVVTITMKTFAWRITGSVSLLSDAAETVVNLAAAILALCMLIVAARPPDSNHHFGHDKAEYFSAAVEGVLIFIAAVIIIYTAVDRLLHPQELESIGVGALVAVAAAAVNGVVGSILIMVGKKRRSPTLLADGKHLWTDVVTSVGVVIGILLVMVTGWQPLDSIVALIVGANIIVTGVRLVRDSTAALMDVTLPDSENTAIASTLAGFTTDDVHFHGLRTRVSARHRFAVVDMLVPGTWSVRRSHDLIEDVEAAVTKAFPDLQLQVHLEPKEDPRAYGDFAVEVPIPSTPPAQADDPSSADPLN
ncbi:MAG: cation diffusion facilitator family transporter [Propionibacteriaceae bacterium]|jgi:cation diffusion facilitator family transporter|nr:cation diffusion facilitator family transporter [Propionibacteriaceae bacterium]